MTKEKFDSLNIYSKKMLDLRKSPVPAKHKDHPNEYRAYIEREIRITNKKIDEHRLANTKDNTPK